MKNKSGFAHLLPIIVIALVIVGVVFYLGKGQGTPLISSLVMKATPTPEPTNKEKEAEEEVSTEGWKEFYGEQFHFKHPAEFEVKTASEQSVHGYSEKSKIFEFLSLESENPPRTLKSNEDISIDGLKGYITVCRSGCEEDGTGASFVKVDVYGQIRLQFVFYGDFQFSDVEKTILKNLKLTKELSDDLETYTNDNYSISFPNNWEAYEITPNTVDINDNPNRVATPFFPRSITIQTFSIRPTYEQTWKVSEEDINGFKAKLYANPNPEEPEKSFVIENNHGKFIVITWSGDIFSPRYNEFQQMLKTFKLK